MRGKTASGRRKLNTGVCKGKLAREKVHLKEGGAQGLKGETVEAENRTRRRKLNTGI